MPVLFLVISFYKDKTAPMQEIFIFLLAEIIDFGKEMIVERIEVLFFFDYEEEEFEEVIKVFRTREASSTAEKIFASPINLLFFKRGKDTGIYALSTVDFSNQAVIFCPYHLFLTKP